MYILENCGNKYTFNLIWLITYNCQGYVFKIFANLKKNLNIVKFFSKSPGLTVPNSKKKNGGNSFSVLYQNGSMASIGDTETFSDYVEDMGTDVDKTEFAIMPTVGPGW